MPDAETDPTDFLRTSMPLAATLGMTARRSDAEAVVVEMDWDARLCTVGGILHGGAMMALADTAGATAAFNNLPGGSTGTSTIESKTNFFGAVTEGTVVATSTPLHVGRTTIVIETDLTNGERRVGRVTQTQAVLWPRT